MTTLTRFLLKLARAPLTLARIVLDGWVWPGWLAAQGVQTAPGLRLVGRPEVRLTPGGQISIGAGVTLASRPASNPMQLMTPCALRLLADNAVIRIGDQSALSGVVICAATAVEIGDHVLIGANVVISDTDFHPLAAEDRRTDRNRGALTRPVSIGADVFIGARAIILKGTTLGDGCVVGAGAVVSGQFPPHSVIAGNPAQIVKTLDQNRS
jgi:hypothetical protein